MQYGHCVVSATATAINSLYLSGIAPPLKAASSKATNPLKASGASSPSFLSFVRFFMSYIANSLKETNVGLTPFDPPYESGQSFQQRGGIDQVGRREAFREGAIDARQRVAGVI